MDTKKILSHIRAAQAFYDDGAPTDALRCLLQAEVELLEAKRAAFNGVCSRAFGVVEAWPKK